MTFNAALPADSSKMKLSAGFIRTNEAAIQTTVSASSLVGGLPFFPPTGSATPAPIWFYLDSAPSGWDLVAAPPTDCLIALKGGTSQYNHAGGTVQGTWVGANATLDVSQIPSHTHNYNWSNRFFGVGTGTGTTVGVPFNFPMATDGGTGGNGPHHHDWTTTRPQAALGVLCTKTP